MDKYKTIGHKGSVDFLILVLEISPIISRKMKEVDARV